MKQLKLCLVGIGNVSWHLAKGLSAFFNEPIKVWGRNFQETKKFAKETSSQACIDLETACSSSDIIILAISDRAIPDLSQELEKYKNALIVHTSGSVAMDVFKGNKSHGVFYPLNTFTRYSELDWDNTPFFLEANGVKEREILQDLACLLSKDIRFIDSETRKSLHIAAVFAGNFTNFFYSMAEELLEDNNLSLDLLRPLIKQTAEKVMTDSPRKIQTGPAARKDFIVMQSHLEGLEKKKKFQHIYKLISEYIIGEEIKSDE
ncbi:MAG: Rossmann-like and DUF2520 domain-containing protein [Bacteroidales bacterium]